MMSAEANFTVRNPKHFKKVNKSQVVPNSKKQLSMDTKDDNEGTQK